MEKRCVWQECHSQVPNDLSLTRRRRATVIIGLEHKVRSFDEALDLYIRAGNPQELKVFHRENRILAYQICSWTTRYSSLYNHTTNVTVALHLRTLSMKITQNIVDRIAVSQRTFLQTSDLQVDRVSSIGTTTVEGGLERAASSRISTITGHGCVKLEGNYWENQ